MAVAAGDVDDMGLLFYRIMKHQGALALAMSVSRELISFSSGVMDFQLQNRDVYTVYAGGDDLFYIGTWRIILEGSGRDGGSCFVLLSAAIPNLL